jgi:hypothetical protein
MAKFYCRNRILKREDTYLIYINIPKDCIYSIHSFIIEYNEYSSSVNIICEDIPDDIKRRMIGRYKSDINNFIKHIEKNLDIYLSGGEPNSTEDLSLAKSSNLESTCSTEDKTVQLPDKYIFPTQNVNTNTLQMDISKRGIYFLASKKLNIQVNCKKCKSSTDIEDSMYCKCGAVLKCTFIPTLDPEILGSLFLDNCIFLHMNPTKYQFNCESCFTNYESHKIGLNTKFRMDCWKCNNFLSFCIKKINYLEKKNQVFKIGSALPDKGACKHYKKSYRWFRFPCCKSVYPCDICHDQENSHPSQLANNMICGFCSKEQSVKYECSC